MKRKKKEVHHFSLHRRFAIGGVLSVVCSVFVILLFFPFITQQFAAPMAETDTNEVHTLPPDIKKVLGTESQTTAYRIPILMYHYVEYVQDKNDTIRQSLDTTPNTLDSQINTLVKAGYTFLNARDVGEIINGQMFLPKKPVVLTFDDGYRDFYTDALPILKKYHVTATAYIVPGFLDKPNYMYTSQVEDIVKNGLVEIGAHTVHHVWLKGMAKVETQTEILQSKKMLEHTFKIRVVSFAYPYGAFDQQAVDLAKTSGFWTAVSTVPGVSASEDNRLFLYRLRPGGRTGEDLIDWLSQVTD